MSNNHRTRWCHQLCCMCNCEYSKTEVAGALIARYRPLAPSTPPASAKHANAASSNVSKLTVKSAPKETALAQVRVRFVSEGARARHHSASTL